MAHSHPCLHGCMSEPASRLQELLEDVLPPYMPLSFMFLHGIKEGASIGSQFDNYRA